VAGWRFCTDRHCAATGLTYAQSLLNNNVGQSVIKSCADRFFQYLQADARRALDKISAGRLITRATNDVERCPSFFGRFYQPF
jgi:ABC-type multidrug transport system fused ATPase/permease subunit